MVLNASKLFILHGCCVFVNKTGKGSRSTFFPISPVLALSLGFFHTPPLEKGGEGGFENYFLSISHQLFANMGSDG